MLKRILFVSILVIFVLSVIGCGPSIKRYPKEPISLEGKKILVINPKVTISKGDKNAIEKVLMMSFAKELGDPKLVAPAEIFKANSNLSGLYESLPYYLSHVAFTHNGNTKECVDKPTDKLVLKLIATLLSKLGVRVDYILSTAVSDGPASPLGENDPSINVNVISSLYNPITEEVVASVDFNESVIKAGIEGTITKIVGSTIKKLKGEEKPKK